MQKIKKQISLLAAFAMILTFILPLTQVFAASTGNGKITITADNYALEGRTLKAYKILNIDELANDGTYKVSIPNELLPLYRQLGKIGNTEIASDASEDDIIHAISNLQINENTADAGLISEFAVAVLKLIQEDLKSSSPQYGLEENDGIYNGSYNEDNGYVEFTNLPLGLYLIAEDLTTRDEDDARMMAGVILTPTKPEEEVGAKLETEPDIEKKIVTPTIEPRVEGTPDPNHNRQESGNLLSGDGARTDFSSGDDMWSAQIGEWVMFRLEAKIPDSNLKDFTEDSYKYVVKDKLSPGLTLGLDSEANPKAFAQGRLGIFIDGNDDEGQEYIFNNVVAGNGATDVEIATEAVNMSGMVYGDAATTSATKAQYAISGDEHEIVIDLSKVVYNYAQDSKYRGKDIIIVYWAYVNNNAVIGEAGNPNEVYLKYTNDPTLDTDGKGPDDDDEFKETLHDYVSVFTFGIKPTKIDGETGEAQPLQGVEFKLFYLKDNGDGTYARAYYKNVDAVGEEPPYYVNWVAEGGDTLITKDDGTIEVRGLEPGIYYLEETKATGDYLKLPEGTVIRIEVKAGVDTAANKDAGEDKWTYEQEKGDSTIDYGEPKVEYEIIVSLVRNVSNKTEAADGDAAYERHASSGSYVTGSGILAGNDDKGLGAFNVANFTEEPGVPLPGTGGMGRKLLYILGTIVIIGSAILLVSKRRMKTGA